MSHHSGAMDEIRIRDAAIGDAAALAQFAAALFDATFGHSVSAEEMHRFLAASYGEAIQRAEIVDPAMPTVIAEDEQGIAGFYQLRLPEGTAPPLPIDRIEIARFYVAPRWHGSGLAASLMDAALERVRELGGREAWLGVWEENARAIAFYRKRGFVPTGIHAFHVGTVEQRDIEMTVRLDGERR